MSHAKNSRPCPVGLSMANTQHFLPSSLGRDISCKTPWAHLDIAGMAFSKYGGALNSGGATGYGVRLLNKLIEDHYE